MRHHWNRLIVLAAACLLSGSLAAQTTQGIITGQITDGATGRAIAGASVHWWLRAPDNPSAILNSGSQKTDSSGYYSLPLLSPGVYRVRAEPPDDEPEETKHQPQEIYELELFVGGALQRNFALRRLKDVWGTETERRSFPEGNALVQYYAADVETLKSAQVQVLPAEASPFESTESYVIDSRLLNSLPLVGRDAYAALVLLPGVTADTTTGRGIGLAINGQRPASSNFLLDGLESNNSLVTGPLVPVAPEAVGEYRVSTSNFSAEYGRTSGYMANAVSRSGGRTWHGLGYFYLRNESLNANGVQQRVKGISRRPVKESQPGFTMEGPLRKDLFVSASFEYLRLRSQGDPSPYYFPPASFAPSGAIARSLLTQYPVPISTASKETKVLLSQPSSLNRLFALPRADYISPGRVHHLMGRLLIARRDQPDLIWSPYRDFWTPLIENTLGVGASLISTLRPNLTNEARLGITWDDLRFERPNHEVPFLIAPDVVLPGSPSLYGYRNRGRNQEIVDNLLWVRGRHILKVGGGLLLRQADGFLSIGRDGNFGFNTLEDFGNDAPSLWLVGVDRYAASLGRYSPPPSYDREYRYNQFFLFAQDSLRATRRLVLNYGVRYENMGAPKNVGAVKDLTVALADGDSLGQRLIHATYVPPGPGDQPLYDPSRRDWAVRAGFAWDAGGNAKTVFRGAYGVFYDRPFDNLWQNLRSNNVALSLFFVPASLNYQQPVSSLLAVGGKPSGQAPYPEPTLYQPSMRTPYVQSFFLGLQHRITGSWSFELTGLGALGRELVTTDLVNRARSVPLANPTAPYNPALPEINYRGNQGFSNYQAMTAHASYRTARATFQASYTWSHTIDDQSEPLLNDIQGLNLAGGSTAEGTYGQSAFTRQFDSRGDTGNATFDQRHNLVFFSIWELPTAARLPKALAVLTRGWRFSQVAAIRSGFPFTVRAASAGRGESIVNTRADLVTPDAIYQDIPIAGGRKILKLSAFGQPAAGSPGNLGRNAVTGPGLYSTDVSLARTIALPMLGESGRLVIRADSYNVLNHANLNNPSAQIGLRGSFGDALYGRKGRPSAFPSVTPFDETARQVQVLLRIEF